jgi:hypothetical protein
MHFIARPGSPARDANGTMSHSSFLSAPTPDKHAVTRFSQPRHRARSTWLTAMAAWPQWLEIQQVTISRALAAHHAPCGFSRFREPLSGEDIAQGLFISRGRGVCRDVSYWHKADVPRSHANVCFQG